MAAEGEFPKVDGDVLYASEINGNLMPVGSVIPWLKSLTNTPALPSNWVECTGQTLSDSDSVYDGVTLPDLNDGVFLEGRSTSGSTGGAATMAHTHNINSGSGTNSGTSGTNFDDWGPFNTGYAVGDPGPIPTQAASNTENRPPFYTVVWIMRIK